MRLRIFLAGVALATFGAPAQAVFVYTVQQVGTSVQVTGSGSFDLSALDLAGGGPASPRIQPTDGFFVLGSTFGLVDRYTFSPIVGLPAFGTGDTSFPDSGFGGIVGVFNGNAVVVPSGYISNSQITNGSTFLDASLTSLGVTPGTYTARGEGGFEFTVQILSASVVPEPATWGMMVVGFGIAGAAVRRRNTVLATA